MILKKIEEASQYIDTQENKDDNYRRLLGIDNEELENELLLLRDKDKNTNREKVDI